MIALALMLAVAQPASTVPPVTVEGVTVEAPRGPAPKVVKTWPAQGAEAPFGVTVLVVSFDAPMDPTASDRGIGGPDAPRCLPTWRLLADARTYVLLCSTEAGRSYKVRFGSAPARALTSAQHRPSEPYELSFTTAKGRTDASLADALKTADRKPEEGPVMDWRAPAPSVAAGGGGGG